MSEIFLDNLIWVILYPLYVFVLIGVGRFFAVNFSSRLIVPLTLLGSFAGVVCSIVSIKSVFSAPQISETVFSFIKINDFSLQFGIAVDKVSIIALLLLFIISLLVQIYSASYMKLESKIYRYYAYLNLFNFGMSILLTAPNLFQSYIGWEVIGVVSYLLIGFKYSNPAKSIAAQKVFIINRIGDVAFLAGIVSIIYLMLSYAAPRFATLDFSDFNLISSVTYAHTNEITFAILCLLFVIAAFVKSAQFPFQQWLLEAMEAPTPVSALIHSATLVIAGTFITIRLYPLLSLSDTVMMVISGFGIFTALYSSFCAICQNNVKRVLAYSTSANLGLVFALIGFGNIDLAIIFLVIHGILKAGLFLSYGLENNEYSEKREVVIPPSFIVFSLILSGLAFSGLNAKEMLFETFKWNPVFKLMYLLVTFVAAVYLFRICSLFSFSNKKCRNLMQQIPIWLLVALSVLIGLPLTKIGLPFVFALVGAIVAVIVTIKTKNSSNNRSKIQEFVEEGFKISFLYDLVKFIFVKVSYLLTVLENNITKTDLFVSASKIPVKIVASIEKYIFDLPVRIITICLRFASREFDLVQTKNAQTYIAYGALIIGIIFTTILLTYSFVLNFLGGIG